jgi:hypothetical protein
LGCNGTRALAGYVAGARSPGRRPVRRGRELPQSVARAAAGLTYPADGHEKCLGPVSGMRQTRAGARLVTGGHHLASHRWLSPAADGASPVSATPPTPLGAARRGAWRCAASRLGSGMCKTLAPRPPWTSRNRPPRPPGSAA